MDRAAQLFHFEETALDSPFVDKIWRTRGQPAASFISVAASHWEMVVTRQDRGTFLTVRGPETKATIAPIPEDAEFFGVQFKLGTYMPSLPVPWLTDSELNLPEATSNSFRLNGAAWDFPCHDDADAFVNRLVREGLLVRDPLVEAAVRGDASAVSLRSVQRRFLRATGLTQSAFAQIERAQKAVELLDRGVSILQAVARAGYVDQPHLTRSLKRFAGQTPAQIARMNGA